MKSFVVAVCCAALSMLLAGCDKDEVASSGQGTEASASVKEVKTLKTDSVGAAAEAVTGVEASGEKREVATFAGGCFWGMEEILRKIPGVVSTRVGYTGGAMKNPSYKMVCTGETGHAEAIEITFDPTKTSYEKLLSVFFRMHDPTTLNRQHNDVGSQYRSAIFYHSDEQKTTAEAVKAKFNASGRFKKPIVTEITKASEFYVAEDYHQKYLVHNPGGYNCHYLAPE